MSFGVNVFLIIMSAFHTEELETYGSTALTTRKLVTIAQM
jgi:hypothetical protein